MRRVAEVKYHGSTVNRPEKYIFYTKKRKTRTNKFKCNKKILEQIKQTVGNLKFNLVFFTRSL